MKQLWKNFVKNNLNACIGTIFVIIMYGLLLCFGIYLLT